MISGKLKYFGKAVRGFCFDPLFLQESAFLKSLQQRCRENVIMTKGHNGQKHENYTLADKQLNFPLSAAGWNLSQRKFAERREKTLDWPAVHHRTHQPLGCISAVSASNQAKATIYHQ